MKLKIKKVSGVASGKRATSSSYKIVVPTMGRYDSVKPLTSLGLPVDRFVLCVNDEDERSKYKDVNPDVEIMVSNRRGCMPNRNWILDQFEEGSKIIMVDDDVEGLFELRGKGKENLIKMTGDEIEVLIEKGFSMCQSNKTKFWGVYPVNNHFFMSRTIVPHGFIVGMWMGIVVSDQRFDTNVHFKDDYAFTCQHILKYKKVVRFNYVSVKAKYLSNTGGSANFRTVERVEQDVEYLIQKYPNWVVRNNNRKGNEILLKFRPEK